MVMFSASISISSYGDSFVKQYILKWKYFDWKLPWFFFLSFFQTAFSRHCVTSSVLTMIYFYSADVCRISQRLLYCCAEKTKKPGDETLLAFFWTSYIPISTCRILLQYFKGQFLNLPLYDWQTLLVSIRQKLNLSTYAHAHRSSPIYTSIFHESLHYWYRIAMLRVLFL